MDTEKYSNLSNPEVLIGIRSRNSTSNASETSEEQEIKQPSGEKSWQWAYPTVEGIPPSQRGGHTATLVGASLVIFGGHYYAGKKEGFVYLNDTVVLDVNENRWYRPRINGTPPISRYGHTAVLAGSRVVLFGGRGQGSVHFRDLHALDPVTMT